MQRIIVILIVTFTLPLYVFSQEPVGKVKEEYKKAPFFKSRSPKKLASYLTESDSSEVQKALNIYTWLVYNIKYDQKKIGRIRRKPVSTQRTLRSKKGICYQYSDLFSALCKLSGISSKEIVGYSKGSRYFKGDVFYENDHSWNGVKLDGQWCLVDATWGSGELIQKKRLLRNLMLKWFKTPYIKDKYKFHRNPSIAFFKVSPNEFINHHLPADPNWQLLATPVQLNEFEKITLKEVLNTDSLDFISQLNDYEFMSVGGYQLSMATYAENFNPKNTLMLASALLREGYSHSGFIEESRTLTEQKETLKEVKTKFLNSSRFAKAHQKTASTEVSKAKRKIQKDVKSLLQTPCSSRITTASRQSTLSGRRLLRATKSIEKQNEWLNNLVLANEKTRYKPLNTLNVSKYEKPSLIEKNLKALSEDLPLIQEYNESLNELFLTNDSLMTQKKALQNRILKENRDLIILIESSIQTIVNNQTFETIVQEMHLVDSLGALITINFSILSSLNTANSNSILTIKNTVSNISTLASKSQAQIEQNCMHSKRKSCDKDNYKLCNLYRQNALRRKIEIVHTQGVMMSTDYNYNIELRSILEVQLDYLELTNSLIAYYLNRRLNGLETRRVETDYYTRKILLKSIAAQKKIQFR